MERPTPKQLPHSGNKAWFCAAKFVVTLVVLLSGPLGVAHATTFANVEKYEMSEVPLLYLEVTLNGVARGVYEFEMHDEQIWAAVPVLQEIGLELPPGLEPTVDLMKLEGVKADYQPEIQQITFVVEERRTQLEHNFFSNVETHRYPAQSTQGILLNYDLFAAHSNSNNSQSGSLFTELRAFHPVGTFNNTLLNHFSNSSQPKIDTIRLDSLLTSSWQDEMVTLRIGDNITGNLGWSRGTRFGGVQLSRNFDLNPYLVTTPLLEFIGSTVTPSNVDLLIDGNKQYSTAVPPGPFIINALPRINGFGNAELVVTDALGQSKTISVPIFYSPTQLQQGLVDWSLEAGYVRLNYGKRSFDYSNDLMASSKLRYGLTSALTLEGQMEGTRGLFKAGIGVAATPGLYGSISASYSRSYYGHLVGNQQSYGYKWGNKYINLGGEITRASEGYRDVASLYGSGVNRKNQQLFLGGSMKVAGNFSVSYLTQTSAENETRRFANFSWFKTVHKNISLNFLVSRNLDDHNDYSVFFGVAVGMENGMTASANTTYRGEKFSNTLNVKRRAPSDGGLEWQFSGEESNNNYLAQLDLEYWTQYATLRGGINTQSDAYLAGGGSLLLMHGQGFATQKLMDSFALVSTAGVENVPIKLENRLVGESNKKGYFLASPLHSYQQNQLSIDSLGLPAGYEIGYTSTITVPEYKTGAYVEFPIKPAYSMSVTLIDERGNPLPMGTEVFVKGKSQSYLVGYDGAVYLEGLSKSQEIVAHPLLDQEQEGGRSICHATLLYHEDKENIAVSPRTTCITER